MIKNFKKAWLAFLLVLTILQPSVLALTSSDVQSIINEHPYYDAGAIDSCTPSAETTPSASLDVITIAKKYDLQSVIVKQIGGAVLGTFAADSPPNTPASVLKLIIADSFLGTSPNLSLSVSVQAKELYNGPGSGSGALDDPKAGQTITLHDALQMTLMKSSDTDANVLIDAAGGLGAVTSEAKTLGYAATEIKGYYSAAAKEVVNQTTVNDLTKAMEHIYTTSGSGYQVAQNALQNDTDTFGLSSEANKWGGVPGISTGKPVTGNSAVFDINGSKYIITMYINQPYEGDSSPSVQAIKNATNDIVSQITQSATPPTGDCCQTTGTPLTGNSNGEKVFNYFIGKGLSNESAAAVTGNLQVESADFTVIDGWGGGGGNYYGLAQWSRNDRYPKLVQFAGGTANAAQLNYQLDFVWNELNIGYKSTLENLQSNAGLQDKTIFWGRNYEVAVNPDGTLQAQADRIADAIIWNNKAAGNPTPPSDSPPSGSCSGGSGSYVNPFHDMSNLISNRIDEGVDYSAKAGTTVPVYALGNGVVTKVANGNSTFYSKLPNWITYKLTDGPAAGKYVYVAEGCPPSVSEGEPVTTDTLLCNAQPESIETGWALDSTSQAAAAHDVYNEGYETAYGVNFNQLLTKLGAPGGFLDASHDPSGQVLGTLPSGWPTW